MKLSTEKRFESRWYKIGKFIVTSAPFAMLLSIMFFWYETYNSDKEFGETINNLQHIEQSLSTRHIGIFPDYLDEINKLLLETPEGNSKIIIFEDILFYGAFYDGSAFKDMIQRLATLANNGKKITIAYYANSKEWYKARMFREVVQESWMCRSDLKKLVEDRSAILRSLRQNNSVEYSADSARNNSFIVMADSIVSEKYFAIYRDDQKKEFSERLEKILIPFYDGDENDNLLFKRIDDIKNYYLNEHEITFHNIYTMYSKITDELNA